MERWTPERIESCIYNTCIKMDTNYDGPGIRVIFDKDNTGKLINRIDDNTIAVSETLINSPELEEDIVKTVLSYISAALVLKRKSDDGVVLCFDNSCKDLFSMIGIKYYTDIEIEDVLRPIRRAMYTDPLSGGSYFSIGDVIKERQLGMGPYIYQVSDIRYISGEIYVSFKYYNKRIPKVFTQTEKSVFDEYCIIDAESWPWKMLD